MLVLAILFLAIVVVVLGSYIVLTRETIDSDYQVYCLRHPTIPDASVTLHIEDQYLVLSNKTVSARIPRTNIQSVTLDTSDIGTHNLQILWRDSNELTTTTLEFHNRRDARRVASMLR